MFARKARSKFRVQKGDGITSKDLQFSFTYRPSTSTSQPRSAWGRMDEDRICLLYFDFELNEKSVQSVADVATTELKFSQDAMCFELVDVAPAEDVRGTSEQQYTQRFDIRPGFDTGMGGSIRGSYVDERVSKGLPDWRFRGSLCPPRPTQTVSWTWTRGGHYVYTRGVPIIKIGVIGKNHPDQKFTGTVKMTLEPRHFWRTTEKHEFQINFSPPSPPRRDDLSARVMAFQNSVVGRDVQAEPGAEVLVHKLEIGASEPGRLASTGLWSGGEA
ncbi:hypothetical protein F1880_008115 [Penicillium rolfsii]|nr:hypothetical protein F1880_008115 [Penicillium rolfsii]